MQQQNHLVARQSSGGGGSLNAGAIALLAVGIGVFVLATFYISLTYLRSKHDEPRWIPTQYLKKRWRRWHPGSWGRPKYSSRLQEDASVPTLHLDRSGRPSSHLTDLERQQMQHGAGVGRNTSIRSIMTLPAYSTTARENEQILGREGERGGIDIVVEHPETVDEEEGRREEEMESLYQIRRQRREELADREERRQRRREARERQDFVALRALRQESNLRAQEREATGAMAMIAEHQSRSRERRVSSVSYGDLGVARHDGSRIRAGSAGSDSQPLLDSAASISGMSMRPAVLRDSLGTHGRGRSTSSIMSGASSNISVSELEAPPFGRAGSDFEVVTLNQRHSRGVSLSATPVGQRSRASSATHRPSIDTAIPPADPPAYNSAGFEDAPPYVSPASERAAAQLQHLDAATGAPTLPTIDRLPSIRIAEATPIEPRTTEAFPSFR